MNPDGNQDPPDESADDILENERSDKLEYSVGQDPLPEDNDSPAAPATDTPEDAMESDHPSQDSDVDDTEKYQSG